MDSDDPLTRECLKEWAEDGLDPLAKSAQMEADAERLRMHLLGISGKLIFDDQFYSELQALRAAWRQVPRRLQLPIGAGMMPAGPLYIPGLPETFQTQLPKADVVFFSAYPAFLKKWGLSQIATWDIPVPQGNLQSVPPSLIEHLRGPDVEVDYYPPHSGVPTEQELRAQLEERQQRHRKEHDIQLPFPLNACGRQKNGELRECQEATALRMWLVEIALRQRYGNRRGMVSRLEEAFEEAFAIGRDHVKDLRKIYRRRLP